MSTFCPTLIVRRTAYIHTILAHLYTKFTALARGTESYSYHAWCLQRGCARVAAAGGKAVFDVLHALGFVRVREPVLAHVDVVAEADGAAGHEDFGDGEGDMVKVVKVVKVVFVGGLGVQDGFDRADKDKVGKWEAWRRSSVLGKALRSEICRLVLQNQLHATEQRHFVVAMMVSWLNHFGESLGAIRKRLECG